MDQLIQIANQWGPAAALAAYIIWRDGKRADAKDTTNTALQGKIDAFMQSLIDMVKNSTAADKDQAAATQASASASQSVATQLGAIVSAVKDLTAKIEELIRKAG